MMPKRSLGQNFLKNVGIAEKMASLAHISKEDTVVEVGPGKGMLTRVLLRHASRVIAVEKDDRLYESLLNAFKDSDGIELIHQDILKCDLGRIIPDKAKIVANLPYNIATQLIMRLVDHAHRIVTAVVMLQKEVAQRICAHVGDKTYSYLSVVVAAGFDAFPGFLVGPDNFFPKPKVDSLVIKLSPKMSFLSPADAAVFRSVAACAFGQRRKTLRNTLVRLPGMDEGTLNKLAEYAGIPLGSRPQDITPDQYYSFSRGYVKFLKERDIHPKT